MKGYRGYTALMNAVDGGKVDIVRLLLAKGARPDVTNDNGKTAREMAVEYGMLDIVEIIDSVSKAE